MVNKKQFILITFEGALALGMVYWFLIQQTSTFKIFYEIYSPQILYFSSYVGLSLLSMMFFGLNMAVAAESWKSFRGNRLKHGSATGASALVSMFGAACPLCGSFLLSAFGLGSVLAFLPMDGMEFLIGSTVLLGGIFWFNWWRLKSNCSDCVVPNGRMPLSHRVVIHSAIFLTLFSFAFLFIQKELLV